MELLFVYNAQKDLLNGAVDYAHKVFAPSTYKCDLCALTHHNLGQRKSWKAFRKEVKADISFHYIKQFEKQFNESHDYPVILERRNGQNRVALTKEDLSQFQFVEELIAGVQEYIKTSD